jgi:hypothetical protein
VIRRIKRYSKLIYTKLMRKWNKRLLIFGRTQQF